MFCDETCFRQKPPLWPIYLAKVLHYANSMMNFFIYGMRSPDFGHFFRKFLCCLDEGGGGRGNSVSDSEKKSRGFTVVSEMGSDEDGGGGYAMTRPLTLDSPL